MNIISCEQVSNGHPDKICDQIADAIVTDCLQHDHTARVAIEVLLKDNHVVIAGELTCNHTPDFKELTYQVFDTIGWDRLDYGTRETPNVDFNILVQSQSPDIAMGVDVGGAGDQGMMYGYATNETEEMLPIPFVLSTKLLKKLDDLHDPHLKADAKAQVSFDYDTGKITTFLCSTQHREDTSIEDVRKIVEPLMHAVAEEYNLNQDFEVLINPTGRFVIGGSWGDCGVTGRKLACDTYGGVGHIGGGAMSGKDPSKVDRSGAYITRKIAKDIVKGGYADKAEVQIAYAIGVDHPVSVHVETFGTGKKSQEFLENFVREYYDLTPRGIIHDLRLDSLDYNLVSSYGHFGKPNLPWE